MAALPLLASCSLLSLNLGSSLSSNDPLLTELNERLQQYEQAFAEENTKAFHNLVHPALQQKFETSKQIFESVFPAYGLSKPKLTRVAIYDIRVPSKAAEPVVDCPSGRVRGVVGPERQIAVFHVAYAGNEQTRFMTIFSAVPESVQKLSKRKIGVGAVMFHTQTWTHERKTPEALLKEGRKWSGLNSPLVAWMYAESALRLLDSNPYFRPLELDSARSQSDEYRGRAISPAIVAEKLRSAKMPWEFLGFTVVFQASGVEPGLHFRMRPGDVLSVELEKCRSHSAAVINLIPELRERFRGVECIPYQPDEDLSKVPSGGTWFLKWDDLRQAK
jgi:hypothetical protein